MKNIRESYKLYKSTQQDCVDLSTYIKISTLYLKFLIEKVINNVEVTLPARLGTLKIIGRKQKISFDENNKVKGLTPNWKDTKKLWDSCEECKQKKQLVYNTNEHSGGVIYKFHWTKSRVLVSNKTLYSLKMTRINKRRVFKEIINGHEYISK